uniref:FxRIamide 1 n=1 Tax=Ambigolimax valentianus TaxID=1338344 RepID=A0A7R7YHC0_9EUPU|nr:FxRIamide 1 [Ambigolimax valentianus]
MQMKRAVMWAAVLLVSTCSFGVLVKANLNSGEADILLRRGSSARVKRMSPYPSAGVGNDAYPAGSLRDNLEHAADSSFTEDRISPCYFVPADTSQSYGFFRTGRSPSSFVRIGKSQYPYYKRHSNFVRIGRSSSQLGNPLHRFRRTSQFVRIGRDPSSYNKIRAYPCDTASIDRNDKDYLRLARSPSNFVRIGRSDFPIDSKRASSFVRIGKSSEMDTDEIPEYSDSTSQGHLGLNSDSSDLDSIKRMSSFVRIGKSFNTDSDLMKRVSNFVRIGKSGEDNKRASSFVRIGKSEENGDNDSDKRASNFVRIGKSGLDADMEDESSKRSSSFVRIGKMSPVDSSFSSPYSQDESSSPFLDDAPLHVVNRGSSFVRIGRMPSSAFVRIGKKSDLTVDSDEYNRIMSG